MRTLRLASLFLLACAGAAGCVAEPSTDQSEDALSGAIFTTLEDGTRVNDNIYSAKADVYLDGGPGATAPGGAAALPEGDYYFMVTDPSGQTLLSSDDLSCRSFHVSADGLIDAVYEGEGGCSHATGIDADHGALTIQLMPYADTPNPGGEYKVWVTPVDEYSAGDGQHGFLPQHSKTDNFKVIEDVPTCQDDCGGGEEPPPPPPPAECGNGVVEPGESCDDGNDDDSDGCTATCTVVT